MRRAVISLDIVKEAHQFVKAFSPGTIAQYFQPTESTLSGINETLVGLIEVIEGQMITKKKDQEDKKKTGKFACQS